MPNSCITTKVHNRTLNYQHMLRPKVISSIFTPKIQNWLSGLAMIACFVVLFVQVHRVFICIGLSESKLYSYAPCMEIYIYLHEWLKFMANSCSKKTWICSPGIWNIWENMVPFSTCFNQSCETTYCSWGPPHLLPRFIHVIAMGPRGNKVNQEGLGFPSCVMRVTFSVNNFSSFKM